MLSENIILSYRLLYLLTYYVLVFSIPVYIYKETGEAAYLGIVFALEWGVRLISLVILPYFFENKNRIKPIYKYNLYQGIIFSILFLSFYLSESILFLIGIGIIASIFFDVNFLYMEYIIQNISGKRNLLRLQSRVQSIEQVSLLLGPVISGLLIDLISVNQFFITIFAFYFLYIALYKNIKINSVENNVNEYRERRNIINGINILYKKDGALELVILTNSLNIIFGACIAIIPVIFLSQYDKTSYLGLFNFIIGLLSIFSIILFNKFMNVEMYNSDRFIGRLSITFYICFFSAIFQYITQNIIVTISLLSIIIIMDSIFSIGLRTKRQLMFSSEEFRIALPSMMLLNAISFPIGGGLIAILASRYSPKESIAIIAVIAIILFFLFNSLVKIIKGKNYES